MNGITPSTPSSAPAGTTPAGSTAGGRMMAARSAVTLKRLRSERPMPPAATATTPAPAALSRNRRRSSPAGAAAEPVSGDRSTISSASAPAAAPSSAGTASRAEAKGRFRAAAAPSTPNRPMPATPSHRRRMATMPSTTANTASSTRVPTMRAGLSLVPKVSMAKVLTNGGTWSITQPPTDTIGDSMSRSAPTSSATPRATAAASRPAMAPCHQRVGGRSVAGCSRMSGSVSTVGRPLPALDLDQSGRRLIQRDPWPRKAANGS